MMAAVKLVVLLAACHFLIVNTMSLTHKVLNLSFRRQIRTNTPSVELSRRFQTPLFMSTSSSSSSNNDTQYLKFYRINGVGTRSRVEMTTNTGHSLSTDVPVKMGGQDSAPQPVETLLAALLGCTQATAIFVGRHLEPRILINRLEFDNIQAVRDERGALSLPITNDPEIPARLQRITGTIRVYTRDNKTLSQEQLALLSHQTELRCPVANMILTSGCEMSIKWINGGPDDSAGS